MKHILFIIALILLLGSLSSTRAFAGEIDVLIEKLVEKGILTPVEAQLIKDETKAQVAQEIAQGTASAMPSWVQSIKMKGDFRLRYQYSQRKGSPRRDRGRVRFRLGIEAKPVEKIKVAAGLATGLGGARSTNHTFDSSFSKGDIRLDYAYAEYAPIKEIRMAGGIIKIADYLWTPSDLLWDSDITPSGGSAYAEYSLNSKTDAWMNVGAWVLEEEGSDESDPSLIYVQPGLTWENEYVDGKIATAYYYFGDLKKHTLTGTSSTNTLHPITRKLFYNYDSINPAAEFGILNPLGLPLERLAFFGEYVEAFDPDDNNNGWLFGCQLGHKKVSDKGQWQMKYMYAALGKDAFPDAFPDSDRYDPGATDIKSHEAILQYAILKNVIFGIDYYQTRRWKANAKAPESLLQADVVYKF